MNSITAFNGAFHVFSNFYPALVRFDGVEYPSVEHAYQAAKTLSTTEREAIRKATKPGTAKALGRVVTLRNDWDEIKLQVMTDLVRQKFKNSHRYRLMLLATANAELIEGNYWRDEFWGATWLPDELKWRGQNHLGKILMQVREELKVRHGAEQQR